LRTNTFGVNVALRRADKDLPVDCRRCHEKPESLGHVLEECIAGKGMRINRHDKMVSKIETECREKELTVNREQSYSLQRGRLNPDLVVIDGERALIVDITVRFESGDSLARGATEVTKCHPLADYMVAEGTVREDQVLPIVVGSRGAVPNMTLKALTSLGLNKKRLGRHFATVTIRSSVEIACMHLHYVLYSVPTGLAPTYRDSVEK
jgi:hypothetical protein